MTFPTTGFDEDKSWKFWNRVFVSRTTEWAVCGIGFVIVNVTVIVEFILAIGG